MTQECVNTSKEKAPWCHFGNESFKKYFLLLKLRGIFLGGKMMTSQEYVRGSIQQYPKTKQ